MKGSKTVVVVVLAHPVLLDKGPLNG